MKVIVFGAAGATGKLIVDECLARGYDVTAFVRDATKLVTRDGVRVVEGDMLNANAVAAAIVGHDAAIHAVGSGNMKASTVRTEPARILVAAMQQAGVKRLVAMSGMGAGESRDGMPAVVRAVIVPLLLGRLLRDQNGLEHHVTSSSLDWTLVRPGELKDVEKTGNIKASLDYKGVSMGVPRPDVAAFIVDQLASDVYLRKAPALGT